jgi:hypothetical protein
MLNNHFVHAYKQRQRRKNAFLTSKDVDRGDSVEIPSGSLSTRGKIELMHSGTSSSSQPRK